MDSYLSVKGAAGGATAELFLMKCIKIPLTNLWILGGMLDVADEK